MAFKWSEKNRGCLKIRIGKDKKAKLFKPGEDIPEELITDELINRFSEEIVEFAREKVIKRFKVKKVEK